MDGYGSLAMTHSPSLKCVWNTRLNPPFDSLQKVTMSDGARPGELAMTFFKADTSNLEARGRTVNTYSRAVWHLISPHCYGAK